MTGVIMNLFDTHCHISLDQFAEDRDQVIGRMLEAGVRHATLAVDATEDVPFAEEMCQTHDFLYFVVGVHPHNAVKYTPEAEAILLKAAKHPRCRAVGEIGLDYHYDLSPRDTQRAVFERQLDLAMDLGMPVQLHIREAHGECMDLLRSRAAAGTMPPGSIMHCFTGSWECAKVYLNLGMYVSLSGAVTFKNAPKLAEVAANVPLDRLLVETDCPYMAPVPLRGRRNEPAFVVHTLNKIAEIRGMEPEALAEITTRNAMRAFRIESEED